MTAESEGHLQPLGIGVLMWDERKVGEEMLLLFTLQGETVVQEKRRATVWCQGPPGTASTQSCIMRPLEKKSPIRGDHKMYVFCNMFGSFITVVMKFAFFSFMSR